MTKLISLIFLLFLSVNATEIFDEVLSSVELETRVKTFNDWYSSFNPRERKVQAVVSKTGKVELHTTEKLSVSY